MADPTIDDIQRAFMQNAGPLGLYDNQVANVATGAGCQSTGLRAAGRQINITTAVANGAVVLPAITRNDAAGIYIIHNNSAVSINVGAAAGDKMNTVLTTSTFGAGIVAIASKTSGIFIISSTPTGRKGVASTSPNNWHGVAWP